MGFERLENRDLLALMLDAGVHYLLLDQAHQAVPVLVSRSAPGVDPLVTGFNLRAQLGDGTDGSTVPVFQAVQFDGGIWDGFPTTVTAPPWPCFQPWVDHPQLKRFSDLSEADADYDPLGDNAPVPDMKKRSWEDWR